MKAGFWDAPEGAEGAMTILPVGGADPSPPWRTGTGAHAFLATMDAAALTARSPHAAALLPELAAALAAHQAEAPNRLFDLTDFPADDRELIGQVMGEGEVGGVAALSGGVVAQIQESVMAGLWRVRFSGPDGALIGDYLEVGAVPEAVREAAMLTADSLQAGAPPEGAMNVMPLIAEIGARMAAHKPGDAAHVVAFSLFPMLPADMDFLQRTLGAGPVQLLSKGYGVCRVLATGTRNVWSVQYFNAMDAIVLDTLEIGGVPCAACAADEDFRDSAERLREIHAAYFA
jgi:hydrogenase-1 operon protein HyaF